MIKRSIFAGAIIGLCTTAAQAADIVSPEAAFDWSGFYLGAQVGYGWGEYDSDIYSGDYKFQGPTPSGDFDGIVGGGHVGYNFQINQLVLGVEGDLEASGMDGSDKWGIEKESIDIGLTGSLRARAGFAFDHVLLYATAGLAGANPEYTTLIYGYTPDLKPIPTTSSNDVSYWGYTVGGGIEYAITESLSARIEYRYTDLGTESFNPKTLICFPTDCKIESDVTFQAVRAGITWHLGGL